MDYKVLITDAALEDLKGIVSFIAEDDASAAVRVGERLIDRALSLSAMPARCPYHDSVRGIRKMTAAPFVIYYNLEETNDSVHILHFWHTARLSPEFQGVGL